MPSSTHTNPRRPPTLNGGSTRKNHYGSRSKRGTEVAALFYTLCETAKLRNVEPRAYLIQAAYAAIQHPGTIILPDVLRDDSVA